MDAETKDLCTALRDPEALYRNGAALADEAAELIETLCARLESPLKSGTEAVARWMISHGYTTGHGDDLDDLLAELVRQVMEPHKPFCSGRCSCGTPSPGLHDVGCNLYAPSSEGPSV